MAELKAAPLSGSVQLQRLARGSHGNTCLPRVTVNIRRGPRRRRRRRRTWPGRAPRYHRDRRNAIRESTVASSSLVGRESVRWAVFRGRWQARGEAAGSRRARGRIMCPQCVKWSLLAVFEFIGGGIVGEPVHEAANGWCMIRRREGNLSRFGVGWWGGKGPEVSIVRSLCVSCWLYIVGSENRVWSKVFQRRDKIDVRCGGLADAPRRRCRRERCWWSRWYRWWIGRKWRVTLHESPRPRTGTSVGDARCTGFPLGGHARRPPRGRRGEHDAATPVRGCWVHPRAGTPWAHASRHAHGPPRSSGIPLLQVRSFLRPFLFWKRSSYSGGRGRGKVSDKNSPSLFLSFLFFHSDYSSIAYRSIVFSFSPFFFLKIDALRSSSLFPYSMHRGRADR